MLAASEVRLDTNLVDYAILAIYFVVVLGSLAAELLASSTSHRSTWMSLSNTTRSAMRGRWQPSG